MRFQCQECGEGFGTVYHADGTVTPPGCRCVRTDPVFKPEPVAWTEMSHTYNTGPAYDFPHKSWLDWYRTAYTPINPMPFKYIGPQKRPNGPICVDCGVHVPSDWWATNSSRCLKCAILAVNVARGAIEPVQKVDSLSADWLIHSTKRVDTDPDGS